MSTAALPLKWSVVDLAELASPEPNSITDGPFGSKLKTEHYRPAGPRVVRLQNIGDGTFLDEEAHIAPDHFSSLKRHQVFAGDLVIAALGEKLPRAAMVPESLGPAIVKADCIRFKVDDQKVSSKYLLYALNSPSLRQQASAIIHGVGRPRMNQGEIKSLKVPLAPPQEQERIVAEIDKQFTRLDAGVEALKRLKAHLRRYRAAVLKAACEGRLVPTEATLAQATGRAFESGEALVARILAERRALHVASGTARRYTEPESSTERDGPTPEGWSWATVEQLSSRVEYGSSTKTREVSDVPVLRMGNIVDGKLDVTSLKFLPAGHAGFPGLLLRPGDVLFNRTNSPELVGKTAVYGGTPSPCSFASYLIRVRLVDGYSPQLLAAYINSSLGREWVKRVVTQQVGQANVNGTKLQALKVPVPPQAEQARIVAALDQRLSELDVTSRAVEHALARASRLRAAILRDAFEGRLPGESPTH